MPGMGESSSSLDSLKEVVHDLKSQLDSITSERNILEKALRKVQVWLFKNFEKISFLHFLFY